MEEGIGSCGDGELDAGLAVEAKRIEFDDDGLFDVRGANGRGVVLCVVGLVGMAQVVKGDAEVHGAMIDGLKAIAKVRAGRSPLEESIVLYFGESCGEEW